MHLQPGQSTSWTQQLDFEDNYPLELPVNPVAPLGSLVFQRSEAGEIHYFTTIPLVVLVIAIATVTIITRTRGRKQNYQMVPDAAIEGDHHIYRDDTNFGN